MMMMMMMTKQIFSFSRLETSTSQSLISKYYLIFKKKKFIDYNDLGMREREIQN